MTPLIKQMRFTEGKESWKVRQESIEKVTLLMNKKKRVMNNNCIAEVMNVLKDRLTETNLNLRAKVLVCIKSIVEAIEDEKAHYTNMIIPELMKLTNETKQNVIDALYV